MSDVMMTARTAEALALARKSAKRAENSGKKAVDSSLSTKAQNDKVKKARIFKEKPLKHKLLAMIHTHAEYKEIHAAGAWGEWLTLRFGVASSKDLNERELGDILDIFEGRTTDRDFIKRQGTATKAQKQKIYAIMQQRRFGTKGKESFIKRQIGEYKPLYLLTKEEASKIITGLERL